MDTLETIFNLQKVLLSVEKLADIITSARYPQTKEERISGLATAIIHETEEVQRLTNWKWWKPVKFDEVQAKEEVIDLSLFLIHMSVELWYDA
jgi:endonuclease III-like uncharacterized protein